MSMEMGLVLTLAPADPFQEKPAALFIVTSLTALKEYRRGKAQVSKTAAADSGGDRGLEKAWAAGLAVCLDQATAHPHQAGKIIVEAPDFKFRDGNGGEIAKRISAIEAQLKKMGIGLAYSVISPDAIKKGRAKVYGCLVSGERHGI